MRTLLKPILMLMMLSLMAGCSLLPPPKEAVDYERYTLELTQADAVQGERVPLTLLVGLPKMRGELASPQMAYKRGDQRLNYYAQSRWADEPNKMLHAMLVEMLTATGPYANVVLSGTPVPVDHRLDIDILDFHQDFSVHPSRFEVKLRVQLIDLQSREIVLQQLLETSEPAPAESPRGGVRAANIAVNRLLQRIRTLLVEIVGAHA